MRLIVTRPAAQSRAWVQQLQALGVDAVGLPLIGIEPPADAAPVLAAWERLDKAALVMFVSANAVAHFFALRPASAVWPAATRAGSTGPGTSAALRAAGVPAAQIVEPPAAGPFDSDTLWQLLQAWPWAGHLVLVVRGEDGRDWLAERLREAGAQVLFVAAYRRVPPVLSPTEAALVQAALVDPTRHRWHFSSSESIAHLVQSQPGVEWSAAVALVTHSRIADNARRHGFGRVELIGPRAEDAAAALIATAGRDAPAPAGPH